MDDGSQKIRRRVFGPLQLSVRNAVREVVRRLDDWIRELTDSMADRAKSEAARLLGDLQQQRATAQTLDLTGGDSQKTLCDIVVFAELL